MSAPVKDMTRGNPAKLIVLFALPLMVGNVFQQLYTMTDAIIVGQFAGVQALGAVGSTDWLSWLVFGLTSGVMQGCSIPVAQRFGAGDLRGLRRCVSTLLVLAAVLAVGFTVLGLIFAGPLLRLIGTQQVVFRQAKTYLSILYGGIFITAAYNLFAALLRALGILGADAGHARRFRRKYRPGPAVRHGLPLGCGRSRRRHRHRPREPRPLSA